MKKHAGSCEGCRKGEWRVIFETKENGERVTLWPLMCFDGVDPKDFADPAVRLHLRGRVVDIDDSCDNWESAL